MISAPGYRELEIFDEIQKNEEHLLDVSLKYFSAPNDLTIQPEGSKIIEFLNGKHVFLTGGTGFVGILTVEKLLRVCPDIGRIYILLRNKKNKTVQQRVEQYFKNEIFEPLKKMQPHFQDKVTIIGGDMSQPNLGISNADWQLLTKNVQVILHGAATVNLEEKFRVAININVKGTQEMLKLAKECPNLVSYIHISTAYSTPNHKGIKEDVIEYADNIDDIFKLLERHSDEELIDISKKVRKDFPNNYAFSKHIAECITKKNMDRLPISIFRPSMIISTYREPLRGWTNNIYGPLGIMLAGGIGLEHIILTHPSTQGDLVPADYVVNGLIATCYKNSLTSGKVYNFVSRGSVQMNWEELTQRSVQYGYAASCFKTLMPVFVPILTTNTYLFYFLAFFLHNIPAAILDFLLKVTGQEQKIKISDGVSKLHKVMNLVLYFNTKQWKFDYDNVDNLWRELSEADRNAFPFNVREVSWHLLLISILFGLRVYIVREPLSTIPEARKRYKRMRIILGVILAIIFVISFITINYLYNCLTSLL